MAKNFPQLRTNIRSGKSCADDAEIFQFFRVITVDPAELSNEQNFIAGHTNYDMFISIPRFSLFFGT